MSLVHELVGFNGNDGFVALTIFTLLETMIYRYSMIVNSIKDIWVNHFFVAHEEFGHPNFKS